MIFKIPVVYLLVLPPQISKKIQFTEYITSNKLNIVNNEAYLRFLWYNIGDKERLRIVLVKSVQFVRLYHRQ